jgi:NADH-quinone oxidoreductase subunit J
METVLFYILAAVIVVGSFLTISSRNILRAAVYLLFVLGATAGIYLMAKFSFLAAVQLTVYAGGIVVLIIFSILLTHQINTILEPASLGKRLLAGLTSTFAGLVFLWAVLSHPFTASREAMTDSGMTSIGNKLMNFGDNGYVLPFEVISVLLLASMIAAIIIAKKFTND